MKAESFVYWLQGLFELGEPETLNERQVKLIRAHLNLVFKHEIDPSLGSEEHREELQEIHDEGQEALPVRPEPVPRRRGSGGVFDRGPKIMC